jgi:hypothetical protein
MSAAPHRALTALGLLVAASAAPHALLGWPSVAGELAAAGMGADVTGGIAAAWYFGSVAMLALGGVVVLAARDARAGGALGWRTALVVGGAYLGFGLGALALRGKPHFIGFVAIGACLAWAALRARPQGG